MQVFIISLFHNLVIAAYTNIYMIKITGFAIINIVNFESCIYIYYIIKYTIQYVSSYPTVSFIFLIKRHGFFNSVI